MQHTLDNDDYTSNRALLWESEMTWKGRENRCKNMPILRLKISPQVKHMLVFMQILIIGLWYSKNGTLKNKIPQLFFSKFFVSLT